MLGRKKSNNWAWLFFKEDGEEIVCKFPSPEGVLCNHRMKKHIGNGEDHLRRKHKIDEGSKIVEAERDKQEGKNRVLNFTPSRFTKQEIEALAAAETFQPFNFTEGKFFRMAFHPTLMSAEGVRSTTLRLATKLREEAIGSMRGNAVTLCFDSGTVWSRYLVIVAKCHEKEIVIGGICDSEWCKGSWWQQGVQTSENVRNILEMTVGDLEKRGVHVAAIVADNASNFQSDDCRVRGTLQLRCCCHVLQLCAKDLMETTCAQGVASAMALLAENQKLPTPVITRWNSTYRLMEAISRNRGAIINDATSLAKVTDVERAMVELKPYA